MAFPIGVIIYWVTNNLFSLGQQYLGAAQVPAAARWPGAKAEPKAAGRPRAGQGARPRRCGAKPANAGSAKTAETNAGRSRERGADAQGTAPKPAPRPVEPEEGRRPDRRTDVQVEHTARTTTVTDSRRDGRSSTRQRTTVRPTSRTLADGRLAGPRRTSDEQDRAPTGDVRRRREAPTKTQRRPATPTCSAQSEIAADYVEGLLDILDYDGDIDELVSAGRPMVEVVGGRLQPLVGQRGATLEALQELTRLAIFRQTGDAEPAAARRRRLPATRRKELAAVARTRSRRSSSTARPVRLEPMSAFERKCVHDVVNAIAGVESESEGVEPNRRIVVRPVD